MPQFVFDTSGAVEMVGPDDNARPVSFGRLDRFTQGYIEALFFTESAPGVTTEEWQATDDHNQGSIPGDVGFPDLAPETLAQIIEDCAKFQKCDAYREMRDWQRREDRGPVECSAGRDFWYTRNGHGCGFWDGDWPEPHATALTEAAKKFGEVSPYLGDDGRVYL